MSGLQDYSHRHVYKVMADSYWIDLCDYTKMVWLNMLYTVFLSQFPRGMVIQSIAMYLRSVRFCCSEGSQIYKTIPSAIENVI